MKQITIDDLIPLLKKGWVAMDENGLWSWYSEKPNMDEVYQNWVSLYSFSLLNCFNIAPFDGDWKDSLRRIK